MGKWMTIRLMALLAAATILAVGVAACGRGEAAAADERVVVEFWHAMGSNQGRMVNTLVEEFNASQTTYRVVPIYQGRYDSLHQKLIASLYARRNPAMSQTYPGWTTRFYTYGYLSTIDELMESDPDFRTQIDDFYPVMIAENTMRSPRTGELELVTLPFNKSVYVLYVNQTRLDAAGLEVPRTWDEFLEVADALTVRPNADAAPSTFGFATRTFIEDLTVQVMAAHTQLLDEETGKINVKSPEVVDAFEFLRKLTDGTDATRVGYVEKGYLSNVFGSERCAMFISSTASFTYNDQAAGDKFIWRAHRVPQRNAETPGDTLMQGTNICIYSSGITDEQRAGAWEFLKFLTSPEATAKWAKETGYMPVRRSANDIPWFAEHLESNISYGNAVATLERAAYEPRLIYWESVRSLISQQVDAVLLGRRTVTEALDEAERTIERIQEDAR